MSHGYSHFSWRCVVTIGKHQVTFSDDGYRQVIQSLHSRKVSVSLKNQYGKKLE